MLRFILKRKQKWTGQLFDTHSPLWIRGEGQTDSGGRSCIIWIRLTQPPGEQRYENWTKGEGLGTVSFSRKKCSTKIGNSKTSKILPIHDRYRMEIYMEPRHQFWNRVYPRLTSKILAIGLCTLLQDNMSGKKCFIIHTKLNQHWFSLEPTNLR